MFKNLTLHILLLLLLIGCNENEQPAKKAQLINGSYVGKLLVQDQQLLPFNFKVLDSSTIEIYNASEVIKVDEISYQGDSVLIRFPAFEGYIKAQIDEEGLEGAFIKESLDRKIPFTAELQIRRFDVSDSARVDITGNWEVTFSENVPEDRYVAKGIFYQEGSSVTGTFRTATGDYRFLDGVVDGNQLKMSAFDGAHAFLFVGEATDSTLSGTFYSDNTFQEPFKGFRNDGFELPDAEKLTFLKDGYDKFEFAFKDLQGDLITSSDPLFENKVTIVQIMGSWCPNCLDESKFYAEYQKNHPSDSLQFVALAFEYAKTEEKAIQSLQRLKERVGIEYPILLAQYGSSSKTQAQQKLPMLNHVLSYPTTIFMDKSGKVRKIHTGFNGPATGNKYTEFTNEFDEFVQQLLKE